MPNMKFFLRPKKDANGKTYWTGYARGNKVQLFEADGKTGIEYTMSMQTPYRASYGARRRRSYGGYRGGMGARRSYRSYKR